jgi:hypothetical protein
MPGQMQCNDAWQAMGTVKSPKKAKKGSIMLEYMFLCNYKSRKLFIYGHYKNKTRSQEA